MDSRARRRDPLAEVTRLAAMMGGFQDEPPQDASFGAVDTAVN